MANSSGKSGGLLGDLDPDMLMALGTGLLSASHYGSNPGDAINQALGAAQQRKLGAQQIALGNIGLQRQQMMLPYIQAYYQAALGGGQNGAQSPTGSGPSGQPSQAAPQSVAGAAPVVGPYSAVPAALGAAPVATPAGASSGAAGTSNPFAIPTPSQIAGLSVGGMSPDMLRLGGILNGQTPLATAQAIRQQQVAVARQQYGSTLAKLDTLDKAQSPTQYVKADPALMAQWQQMAPSLGFDPQKGFTDPNVRTAFSFLRNQIGGALGLPTIAPPVQMAQTAGPLNSLLQRNPVTNAVTQVRPEESLKSVVGPNGQVTYVPASQASGQQVFSDETYVNPTTTQGMARMIANYEIPPLSGYALRSSQGQAIMAAVKQLNPSYDSTQFTTKQHARQAFATGKQGDIVRSLSVATNHLDQLSQAADALAQHDFPTFNRISNAIGAHVTGANPQTNFDAMKEIVGDEVVKAVVGTSGAEGDREAIKNAFDAARSPAQIQGVIQKYEGLMGGQLSGLKRQYRKATGLNDFDSFVSQQAQQTLTPSAGSVSDAALLKKWGGQ